MLPGETASNINTRFFLNQMGGASDTVGKLV